FVAGRLAQVAIQLACGDPASNRAAVDPEQFRNGGLAQSLLEVMSQQHASLQSDQVRLHRVGESARCTIGRESVYAPPLRLPATTSEPGGTFSSAKGGKFSTAGNSWTWMGRAAYPAVDPAPAVRRSSVSPLRTAGPQRCCARPRHRYPPRCTASLLACFDPPVRPAVESRARTTGRRILRPDDP